MKIFAFHLLNDYSGSPKVLMQLLKGWSKQGISVTVVTASGRDGFLSGIPNVHYRYFTYNWAANPFIRLWNLMISQLSIYIKMYRQIDKNDIIYINTVLPFGAALIGKIKGCRVIYHIHETSIKPALLKKFLFGMVRWAATDVIYVSNYLAKQENIEGKSIHILYNAIEQDFLEKATQNRKSKTSAENVLMVCSLKAYKGVNEFVNLAKLHPEYAFKLVINASQHEIDVYFKGASLPNNLHLFDTQKDLHPFYSWADLVCNLSKPDGWVETFGLTIIEGMAYGLPAIIPPVGGITELVEPGENGYAVDSRDIKLLSSTLRTIFEDTESYVRMNDYSKKAIHKYSEETFIRKSIEIIMR